MGVEVLGLKAEGLSISLSLSFFLSLSLSFSLSRALSHSLSSPPHFNKCKLRPRLGQGLRVEG